MRVTGTRGDEIAALGGADIEARQQDRRRLTERVVERRRRVDIAESEVPTALSVRHPAGVVVRTPAVGRSDLSVHRCRR